MVDAFVEQIQAARAAEVDRLRAEMASRPDCGILVESWADGRWTATLSRDVEPLRVTYVRH